MRDEENQSNQAIKAMPVLDN